MSNLLAVPQGSTSPDVRQRLSYRWARSGHVASIHVRRGWLCSDEDRHARVPDGVSSTRGLGCHSGMMLNGTDGAPLVVMRWGEFFRAYRCREASQEGRSETLIGFLN